LKPVAKSPRSSVRKKPEDLKKVHPNPYLAFLFDVSQARAEAKKVQLAAGFVAAFC